MTIKATIILLTVAAVWALHMISSNILASDCETVAASLEYLQFLPLSVPKTSLGRRIIEKSFHESFADLVETCGILNETDSLEKCLRTLYQRRKEPGTVYNEKWPWWFQTMIRDAKTRSSGLFGAWHILQFSDPLMQLCVYEKGGTKMWRHVHCQALANRENTTDVDITNCFKRQGALATKNVEKSVFLRDPLERFLSGFLDKCTTKNRIEQSHCQPNIIFSSNPTDYVADFLTETKKLFEVYVDTLPLKWDLHFLPLSLQCGGLYQKIEKYDFVGMMNESFYQELGRFLDKYPNLDQQVRKVFRIDGKENKTNHGTELQASLHTWKYYTPNTIRRVLQYTSIDYILLNMTIPDWAESILKGDDTFLL